MVQMQKASIIAAIFSPVPLWFLLTFLTQGRFEPRLPGADTWNIQYLAPLVIAIVAAFLALRFKNKLGAAWCAVLMIWNSGFAVLALSATFSLWGDKY